MVQRQLALGRRSGGADQADAFGARPLAGDQPHPPGGGVEEDAVAALQRHGAAEEVVHRQALEHHGRPFVEGDALGQGADLACGHNAGLGIGAGGVAA